jgi:hypothetical protein
MLSFLHNVLLSQMEPWISPSHNGAETTWQKLFIIGTPLIYGYVQDVNFVFNSEKHFLLSHALNIYLLVHSAMSTC